MKKKTYQIISFLMTFFLIISLADLSVFAVEQSVLEEQPSSEIVFADESEEIADDTKSENFENSSEATDIKEKFESISETENSIVESMITTETQNDTIENTKADNIIEEETSSMANSNEEENASVENSEIQVETETESDDFRDDISKEIKIELISELEMEIGQVENILLSVYPNDLNEKDIIWNVENPHIAAVENGQVVSIDIGETDITASIADTNFESKCHVKVIDEEATVQTFSFYSAPRSIAYDGYGAAAYAKTHNDKDIREGYGDKDCSEGKVKGKLFNDGDTNDWLCADLVAHSAVNGGGLPEQYFDRGCTALRKKLKNSGYCTEYIAKVRSDGYIYKADFSGTIAIGDIILYYCPSQNNNPHAVMFAGWSNNGRMKAYAHNRRNNGNEQCYPKCGYCSTKVSLAYVMHFNGNTATSETTQKQQPIGHLDGIEGGKGTVTAIGWAVDPDDYSKDVDIHIYVGGNIGVGGLYIFTSNNESRSDVKNEHPNVKENCGFNYTFKVNERGTQEVYVYAIDTQGTSTNKLIGHTTITIANPDPVIRINPDNLQLNVNDTKPLTVSFEISETYKLNYHIADTNIASAKWGTPANGKCDLTIKGLKKGYTTIDIQLWNEAMTTLIYNETIPITVTELSVDFSQDIVETNENKIKTFEFHFSGSDLYGLECDIGDRSIVDLTDWKWDENNYGTISVQGYKEGTTNLTVYLIGVNNTILFSQSIPITVTKPFAGFGQNRMDINVNNTKEIAFSFKGSNLQDIGLDIGDPSIASLETWFWDENNNGTIKIKGHKKGTTTMTLYLIGADGSRICSKSIPIYVNNNLTGITLNTYSKELTVGESFQLTVFYTPSDAKPDGSVQWSSSNTHIVVVDAHGRIKAVKAGSAIITATIDGFSKTCRVTVIEKESSETGTSSETEESSITESTRETETATENMSESGETTKPEEESSDSKEESSISDEEFSDPEESSITQNTEETETTTEKTSESEDTTKPEEESSDSKEEFSDPEEESSESEEESSKPEEESSKPKEESSRSEEEITNKISINPIKDIVYTGTALKPELDVYNGSKKLLLNKDYTVSYKNNVAAGTAYAIVKGKGNYSDKVTTSFNILPKDLSDTDVIAEDLALAVNHKVQKKIPTVSYNGKKLKLNKDFKATFGDGNFTEKGTYTVTLTGMNNYTGSIQAKIILTDKKNLIKNAKITYPSSHPYTGKEITPPVTVMCNNNILTNGKDYTVSYVTNINPGKGTIVITGKGNYAGTKTVKFTITKTRTILTDQMIDIKSSVAYIKGGCFPKPLVICNGKTLVMGRDYTVSYKNNKSVGIATLSVKGKGTYSGTVVKSFEIKQQNINKISVRVPDVAYNERSRKYISTPILMDSDGNMLKRNKDYGNVSYSLNGTPLNNHSQPAIGSTITVTLSGIGNYTGTITQTYKLKRINFSKVKVSGIKKTYTGSAVTIAPSDLYVTLNGNALVYGKDYTIVKGTYKNSTKKGQASVVIKGLGEYAGEKIVKFRITARPINS